MRGAWIEILALRFASSRCSGRSPCGERGLKSFLYIVQCDCCCLSLPVRGAWIEIRKGFGF